MTRDEAEAALRRNLTSLHVPEKFHNAVVDNFLPVIESYAVYVGGITADRRAELGRPAAAAVVHYSHPIACCTNAKLPTWTGDWTRVTCVKCKRTFPYREAASRA